MNASIPRHFFFGLLLAVIILAVLIFLPFLTPLVLAAAMSVVFRPIHRWINRKIFKDKPRSNLAALVSVIILILLVFVPLFLIGAKIYAEIQNIYSYLIDEAGRSQVIDTLNRFANYGSKMLFNLYPSYSFDSFDITSVFKNIVQWIFSNLDEVFRGTTQFVLGLFILILALFYFFRDGRELRRQIIVLSPLANIEDEKILKRMEQAIFSVFAGSLATSIIQGILTGIGFALFGVPNPALWGAVAAIAALIPGVGTSLILVPAVLYLFLTGQTAMGIGFSIWSLLAVGLIDNFLGPIFINRGIRIHPFLILLSVLGGLLFFGPIGFVLGPIILALLSALLEIYKETYREQDLHLRQ